MVPSSPARVKVRTLWRCVPTTRISRLRTTDSLELPSAASTAIERRVASITVNRLLECKKLQGWKKFNQKLSQIIVYQSQHKLFLFHYLIKYTDTRQIDWRALYNYIWREGNLQNISSISFMSNTSLYRSIVHHRVALILRSHLVPVPHSHLLVNVILILPVDG